MKESLKIGMFIGKFLPPHIGHTNQIKKSLSKVDFLYVIVADSKERTNELCKEAGIDPIDITVRANWLKTHFEKDKNIEILTLDQGMLEAFPNELDNWKNKLETLVKNKVKYWFVDNNYLEISKKYFPEYEFIGFDRSEINISASQVRDDLGGNIKYIIPEAKEYFLSILNSKS